MKEIKTIKWQLDASKEFDAEVNAALAEGWTLVRRYVLPPYGCGTVHYYRMFVAELERETEGGEPPC